VVSFPAQDSTAVSKVGQVIRVEGGTLFALSLAVRGFNIMDRSVRVHDVGTHQVRRLEMTAMVAKK
jgi:hypothetical protein